MLSLLCALVMPTAPRIDDEVTVWARGITLGDLAAKLSTPTARFTVAPSVTDHLIVLFSKDRPRVEIARQVAECLGMSLRERGTEYRFVPNAAFESAFRDHEENVAQETRAALRRLALDLRRRPPHEVIPRRESDSTWSARRSEEVSFPEGAAYEVRKRAELERALIFARASRQAEVLWMLARASDAQLEGLMAGHSLMGSVPARQDGSIDIPGTPADYQHLRHLKHAYVVTQLDPREGELTVRYYSRGAEIRGMGTSFSVLMKGGSVYSFGEPWSRLGEVTRQWRANGSPVVDTFSWRGLRRPFGEWLEGVAKATKRPVVAIASPLLFGDFPNDAGAIREDANWLHIWPPLFWSTRKDFAYLDRPAPNPDLSNPVAAIDAAVAYVEGGRHSVSMRPPALPLVQRRHALRQRGELQFKAAFIALWQALSPEEKRTALRRGLPYAQLSPNKQAFFEDALFESTTQSIPKGEAVDLVAPEVRASVRMRLTTTRTGLLTDGSSGGTFPLDDAANRIRLNPDDTPFEALNVTVAFESGRASCQGDFYVLREYQPQEEGGTRG